ncbi:twin-arginine translocase subunit TatC [Membranicola marinus]|uniref:Sec-independent protein translocase protein TatC n=1 Tax=Membranihabitans marinus TaxID=1227546 RepID=A0A953HST8_9BACT|nr:twin-arginine translocase subunit TatC [Membranihabitans marinus]MBY5957755.1 twin-arginine translocase subunit TatC [Membranihabitans marinus]
MPLDQIDVDNIDLPSEEGTTQEMSFLDHLEELRWHLIRAILSILAIAIVVFVMKNFVFENIIFAPKEPDFATYRFFCWISDALCFSPPDFKVQAFKIEEQFVTHIKVSIILGFIVSFPYVFYEMWKFVKPGLYKKEVVAARGIVGVCSTLFLIGVAFGYFIITPFALTFLTNYNLADTVAQPTLTSYVNNLTMYTLPTGLIFELPVVMFMLAKIGLVTAKDLKTYRKVAFVVILVVSAIITPPDLMTQLMITIPLYALYELSIKVVSRVEKNMDDDLS